MPTKRRKNRKPKTGEKPKKSTVFIGINMADVVMAQKVLRAINHPIRRRILLLIQKHQPVTVTKLFTRLRLDQSFVSQYLMVLRSEGYVYSKKVGRQMFYVVNNRRFRQVARLVRRFR